LLVINNTFRFDLGTTNGTTTPLLLIVEKKSDGKIILKSLTNKGSPSKQIDHAEMYSTTDVPDWAGKTFSKKPGPEGYADYIKFSTGKSMYVFTGSTAELPQWPGYAVGVSIGLKDDRVPSKMFIFIPYWKGAGKINVLVDPSPSAATYGTE